MREDPRPPATFTESEAQRILARAAELEGTIGTRFTAEDLRQIAATAGIDREALEFAIKETDAVPARPALADTFHPLNARDVAIMAGAGAALGALAIVADNLSFGGASTLAVFGPSALYTFYKALKHPLREGIPGLLRDFAVVFGSFTAAIIAMEGFRSASPAMAWSLMCGAIGSGILALRGARLSGSAVADSAAADLR